MEYVFSTQSPLGKITLASDGNALTGLWFAGQKKFAGTLDSETCEKKIPVFDETMYWLDTYFSGKDPNFTPPLAPKGTLFRKKIWGALREIPFGKTATYSEIARRVTGTSPRAVGGALGDNPIAILIPCHRVIGVNGTLTGYAGGLLRKTTLLQLEHAQD